MSALVQLENRAQELAAKFLDAAGDADVEQRLFIDWFRTEKQIAKAPVDSLEDALVKIRSVSRTLGRETQDLCKHNLQDVLAWLEEQAI